MKNQLLKAIGAHGLWKARLKNSLDSGCIEFDEKTVEKDNMCELGIWLYSDEVKPFTSSPHYQNIKELHADFHQTAAQILRLIDQGRKIEAEEMMSEEGQYTLISRNLVDSLAHWSQELSGGTQ